MSSSQPNKGALSLVQSKIFVLDHVVIDANGLIDLCQVID
jgi:hypothetical protein